MLNLALRLIIFYNTDLFYFSDFRFYLNALEKISNGEAVPLASGNFLFAISHIGYFFKYVLGNLDYFFWVNSLLGAAASVIISLLVYYSTSDKLAAIINLGLLTIYTEFIAFSSVFYTVVIMIFLLASLIFILYKYYETSKTTFIIVYAVLIILLSTFSFLFKQELLFLPVFLLAGAFILRKNKSFLKKTFILSALLSLATIVFYKSGVLPKNGEADLVNDFVFFGHTDYGGDGGEGAFIYPENKKRYDIAWEDYLILNRITTPTITDRNRFQAAEIKKFVLHHPGKWVKLQLTKLLRTFGVVPESISYKILYTGLLKNRIWLTSIIVVSPVAIIVLLFIILFDHQAIRRLINPSTGNWQPEPSTQHPGTITQNPEPSTQYQVPSTLDPIKKRQGFLFIYLTIFIYYMLATIFFGQYQERYRMPLMVVFIIPALSYFIASFDRKLFLTKKSLISKSLIVIVLLIAWSFQAHKAINNKGRLKNAIESAEIQTGKTLKP